MYKDDFEAIHEGTVGTNHNFIQHLHLSGIIFVSRQPSPRLNKLPFKALTFRPLTGDPGEMWKFRCRTWRSSDEIEGAPSHHRGLLDHVDHVNLWFIRKLYTILLFFFIIYIFPIALQKAVLTLQLFFKKRCPLTTASSGTPFFPGVVSKDRFSQHRFGDVEAGRWCLSGAMAVRVDDRQRNWTMLPGFCNSDWGYGDRSPPNRLLILTCITGI